MILNKHRPGERGMRYMDEDASLGGRGAWERGSRGERGHPCRPEQRGPDRPISAPVAIVYGCSHACTFCIIPQKRGIGSAAGR
jgi:tRNA A37 methylthiotransferase MiaB